MNGASKDGAPDAHALQLQERLAKIRSQPKLQSQQQTAVVLKAVEDTLKDQKSDQTPTAYFAALLSILNQSLSPSAGFTNKEVATAVVYLLDLFFPHVPPPLLRSKFAQILNGLTPALSLADVDAPFLRPAVGCLESLLIAQDGQAWAIPQSQVGPRKALGGLLNLALDHRPKVRKRAQDAVSNVLRQAPPGPSVEHPAADMCAETSMRSFQALAKAHSAHARQQGGSNDSELIHVMHLIKSIARAAGGWPSRSLDSLCEVLFGMARSRSEFLTTNAFEVFDTVFEGMAADSAAEKLPKLIESMMELQPSLNDSQLLPPWIALISRGYDVLSQIDADETFQKLPDVFGKLASFLASPAYNIRVSASECLISFLVNCVPASVILEPSIYDEKVLEKLGTTVLDLYDVKFQSAWMEVFDITSAVFEHLRWRADPIMRKAISAVGDLRSSDSFQNKDKADEVLKKAIQFVGPETVLQLLPLNLAQGKSAKKGRAWLVPLIRDSVANTNLNHFKTELVPVSETLFSHVTGSGGKDKTMVTKIYEDLISQIWSCLPGYCDRPLDVKHAFDQQLAEVIAKLLYQNAEMRTNLCRALQNLVESFKSIAEFEGEEDLIAQGRISKAQAQENLDHLSGFSPNILAVLFNVYGETKPHNRGPILSCVNAYLSIAKPAELAETFERVVSTLESSILQEQSKQPQEKKSKQNQLPPISHALMDIIVTMAIYLPRESYQRLFAIATTITSQTSEPQLQKKAYKLIPRLSQCEMGKAALLQRSPELQELLLSNADKASQPARRDRMNAVLTVVETLSSSDLHFIPAIIAEVISRTKETNERTRETAFSLIIKMGEKMKEGGSMGPSASDMESSLAQAAPASIDEYFTILSAGLAGTTPHMISASITAISRALFEFHASLAEASLDELLSTMDLFLQSPTREVVRSVLGLVKVCIVSLPRSYMQARLPSLIPHLISWSHEHKGDFRSKVRNILDRVMRHFGVEILEQNCPDQDRKLITNIRKTRERKKKQKTDIADQDDEADGAPQHGRRAKFENEFDEAVYGSDESDSAGEDDDEAEKSVRRQNERKKNRNGRDAFIHEDDDEPLDLLDRRALANISSTKPLPAARQPKRTKAKTDVDGKLILRDDDEMQDDDAVMMEFDQAGNASGKGVDAYVEAIRGKHSAKRGQRGKLKFSNKPSRGEDDFDEGEESTASGRGEIKRGKQDRRGGKQQSRGGAGRANNARGGRVGKRDFRGRR